MLILITMSVVDTQDQAPLATSVTPTDSTALLSSDIWSCVEIEMYPYLVYANEQLSILYRVACDNGRLAVAGRIWLASGATAVAQLPKPNNVIVHQFRFLGAAHFLQPRQQRFFFSHATKAHILLFFLAPE
jgi:hypothetical protein